MEDSYLSTQFAVNSLDGFWENINIYALRTDDGRPRPGISSTDTVNSDKVIFITCYT